ncbi:MAG: hypothetical protein IGQ88_07280 [Gloeomargaritaceae cyanobacterium C42_A2020_066]|nr:hypothetical protein [Gloeomargaritaceae cyanobacterium C42_A2020_066]
MVLGRAIPVLPLVALALGGCALGPPQWQTFQDEQGGFTVEMPGRPASTRRPVQTGLGEIEVQGFGINRPTGVYALVYADYPEPVTPMAVSPLFWDRVRLQTQRQLGAKDPVEKPITLGSHPGREITLTLPPDQLPEGGIARARYYFVDRRVYGLYALVPQTSEADLERFFQSFRLQAQPPANP